ncbi:PIKK family atypical protein kinase [Trichomonas vaginalis G3]|uniref:non-specific serine/threonine protein kinase n=1 Tax=Trichomonas vaginalis (strain ATCC PRA-98 / G3) TaxID=412133 RepID=A2ELF3_TRIV3|nr:ataxia telangiectasia mutated (ATM) -related family [Trichomonas vaginalis G3]EAY06480.1 PIKK family atypical protein kinase [Trichomonas vaginalis G3]KAI5538888.1 ataxia telangiectasia mutated (ATM) -related family [Trichomonas vaginalis G3]|eukprot:XP_001318703.1 PIKK family atypical protein kinase [Trichomonas vaginalis G3]
MSARVSYSELIARAREKRDAEYKKLSSFTISQIETATEKAMDLLMTKPVLPVDCATIVFTLIKLRKDHHVKLFNILSSIYPTKNDNDNIFISFVFSKLIKHLKRDYLSLFLDNIEKNLSNSETALSAAYFIKFSVENAPSSILFCFTKLINVLKLSLTNKNVKVQFVSYETLKKLVQYLIKTRTQQKHDAEIDFVKILLDSTIFELTSKNSMCDLLIIAVYLEVLPNDLSSDFLQRLLAQLINMYEGFTNELRGVALYVISLLLTYTLPVTIQKKIEIYRNNLWCEASCPTRFTVLALIHRLQAPDIELANNCRFSIIKTIFRHKLLEVSKLGIILLKTLCDLKPDFITTYKNEIISLLLETEVDETYCNTIPSIVEKIWDDFRPNLINLILKNPGVLYNAPFLIFLSNCKKLENQQIRKMLFILTKNSNPLIRGVCPDAILAQYDKDDTDIMEPINLILALAHNDPVPFVREKVLISIPESLFMYLTNDQVLNSLSTLTHDDNLNVRNKATILLCKISKYNPFVCYPILRKILLDSMFILNSNRPLLVKEESAVPLPEVISAIIDSFSVYASTFCDISLHQISFQSFRELSYFESKAILNLNTTLIKVIGIIAESNMNLLSNQIGQFHNFFLYMLQQHFPKNLKLAIIHTMYSYLTHGCDTLKLDIKRVFPTLINIASMWNSRKLNIAVLKLIGFIGAIKDQTDQTTQPIEETVSNHYCDENLISLTCRILLNILTENSLLIYHLETVKALVDIFADKSMTFGFEFFKDFIENFLSKFDSPSNLQIYLGYIGRICSDCPPSWVALIGNEILDLVMKIMSDPANEQNLAAIFNLLPILVKNYSDIFIMYLSGLINFLLDSLYKYASENAEISKNALIALISIRSLSHDYLFLIFPDLISTANSNDTKSVVKLYTLIALRVYIQSCDCSSFVSATIRCALNAIITSKQNTDANVERSNVIIEAAQQVIYSIMVIFGKDYFVFHDSYVKETFIENKIPLTRYQIIHDADSSFALSDYKFIDTSIPISATTYSKSSSSQNLNAFQKSNGSFNLKLTPNSSADNFEQKVEISEPCHFLEVNETELKDAFSYNETETLWSRKEWWTRIVTITIKNSPNRFIHSCYYLCTNLIHIAEKLFNAAFLSCWKHLDKETKIIISASMTMACNSDSLPNDIRFNLVKLFEYMEQNNESMMYMDSTVILRAAEKSFLFEDALYFASKIFPNNIEDLVRVCGHLKLDKTIQGLTKMIPLDEMKNKPAALYDQWMQINMHRKSLKAETVNYFRSLKHLSKWRQVANEKPSRNNMTPLEMNECAPIFAAAYFNLERWDELGEMIDILKKNSVSTVIMETVYKIKKGETDKAKLMKEVEKGFVLLANKAKSVFKHNNTELYPSIIKAQQLQEVTEIINWSGEQTLKLWTERLEMCPKDPYLYSNILPIRLAHTNVQIQMPVIIKLLKLYLKTNNYEGFDGLIDNLFNDGQKITPYIKFLQIKCNWQKGDTFEKEKNLQILKKTFVNNNTIKPKLLARIYYTIGDWIIQNDKPPIKREKLLETIQYINFCFNQKEYFYKATHRWSWANACLYKQDNSQIKCAANAVLGFIQSIEKREESFSDMIQMIYLVFTANFSEIEIQKIGEKLLKFDTKFLQISPQLFAKLGKTSSQSQQLVIKLLQKLFKVHYHSLLFPLLLCIRENLPNSIRIDQDVTFSSLQVTSPEEEDNNYEEDLAETNFLSECKNESAAELLNWFYKINPKSVREAITISEGLLRCSSTKIELLFSAIGQAMRLMMTGNFSKAKFLLEEALQSPSNLNEDKEFMSKIYNEVMTVCKTMNYQSCSKLLIVYNTIKKYIQRIDHITINDIYPNLSLLKDTKICVPGTYKANGELSNISYFEPVLKFFPSKQRPRLLIIVDTNGQKHLNLLKGCEDLRLDERIMQFFGLINQHIKHDLKYKNHELNIFRYSITPISRRSGLIEFVTDADTIYSLLSEYRKIKNTDPILENHCIEKIVECNIDSLSVIQRYEVLKEVKNQTKENEDDLKNIMWYKSPSAADWVLHLVNFSQSCAMMSMIGYIIGLGDRHPSNIMIHQRTGSMIHIDFGDCFEVNKIKVRFPETIPFRLTRMFVNAFGPTKIEGNFRITCKEVLSLMRTHKDSIMAVLDIFLQEPLDIDVIPAKENNKENEEGQVNDEENFNFGDNFSLQSNDDEEVMIPIIESMNRVMCKISGRDNEKQSELDIPQQVDQLIRDATDMYNLAHLFHGWSPLW